MRTTIRSFAIVAAVVALPMPAFAQVSPTEPPSHATSLQAGAGVWADSGPADPWAGGSASWQLAPQMWISASGLWQDRGPDASGFGGDLALELGVMPNTSRVKPFIRLGVGAYRATFRRTGVDGQVLADDVPEFYARRLAADPTSSVFTDPTVIAGFGIDVPVAAHLSVRPDARFMWVVADGRAHAMAFVGIQLAFEIEHHPVTPARR